MYGVMANSSHGRRSGVDTKHSPTFRAGGSGKRTRFGQALVYWGSAGPPLLQRSRPLDCCFGEHASLRKSAVAGTREIGVFASLGRTKEVLTRARQEFRVFLRGMIMKCSFRPQKVLMNSISASLSASLSAGPRSLKAFALNCGSAFSAGSR